MPKALPNPSGKLFVLNDTLLAEGRAASRKSPRKRIIMPVQRSQKARVQRLLNFLQPGTYIRPHQHPLPHATESLSLISGHLEILIFNPDGTLSTRHQLSPATPLIDIEPGVWHGMIVKKPDTVIFEVKQGPYEPMDDKDFAGWAPEENSPEALPYLRTLEKEDS